MATVRLNWSNFAICIDKICFAQHWNTSKLNLQTPLYCCCDEENNLWFMQRRQQKSKMFSYSSNSSQSIRMSTVSICVSTVLPIHNYIIGHYNHSVGIIDLVSHTTYVVCVNFIYNCWVLLQFKFDSERQIFWETIQGSFYLLFGVFARYLLRRNRQRNTFCILFWCLAWNSNPGFTSNSSTHYLLDYGDFNSFGNIITKMADWSV